MTVETTLDAIAPELASTDGVRKAAIIAIAETRTSATAFEDSREYAVALLAAHTLTVGNRGGASGVVISKKEADLAITYADPTKTGDSGAGLNATSYGQELLLLRKQYIMGPRTVVV